MTAAARTPATPRHNQIFENRPEKRNVRNLKNKKPQPTDRGEDPRTHEAVPRKVALRGEQAGSTVED